MQWFLSKMKPECNSNEYADTKERLDVAERSAVHHRIEARKQRDFAQRALVDAENADRLARLYETRIDSLKTELNEMQRAREPQEVQNITPKELVRALRAQNL